MTEVSVPTLERDWREAEEIAAIADGGLTPLMPPPSGGRAHDGQSEPSCATRPLRPSDCRPPATRGNRGPAAWA